MQVDEVRQTVSPSPLTMASPAGKKKSSANKDPNNEDNTITLRNKKVVVKGEGPDSDVALDSDDNFLISDSSVGALNNKISEWIDEIESIQERSKNFKGSLSGRLKAIVLKAQGGDFESRW